MRNLDRATLAQRSLIKKYRKEIWNPFIAAMMLRYSFDMEKEAKAIEDAVSQVLDEGYRTADIMPSDEDEATKCIKVSCSEMGKLIESKI